MKILVLTIEYPPLGGGASAMIHELNKRYIDSGHEVHVVTMSFADLPEKEVMDEVKINRVKGPRSKKYISYPSEHLYFLFSARKFLKILLNEHSFDLNHSHFILPTGLLSRWIFKHYGIPYIITAHGSDIPRFNPDRFTFLHRFSAPVIRSIVNQSTLVVTPSEYLASLLLKVGGLEKKSEVIANGIDTNYFTPGNKKNLILSSGRLLERKGFQYLIKAVTDENLGYEVHICGDGPLRNELEELATKSKTKIIFHGWLDNRSPEYKELLSEASIYCLLSTNENASITLLEALSSGCAVITSNVSGCPETVGSAGICISPEDINMLQMKLKQLIEDNTYRNEMMDKARERAVNHFNWTIIAQSYLERIKSITG
ncbi:MAG: glycosyltransferase family 4 protein [Saprospiraceae bacterium]